VLDSTINAAEEVLTCILSSRTIMRASRTSELTLVLVLDLELEPVVAVLVDAL